jgi:hypothetical protein
MTATPEYTWGSSWDVHNHYDRTTTVIFDDSGRINIYFRLSDDGDEGDIWDLDLCEASSLVHALTEALKAAELRAAENRRRAQEN